MYATVARGCSDPRVTLAIMKGMAAALIMEAGLAFWERFELGMAQTGGSEHQNLLGLMLHIVILPFFALLLAGRRGLLPAVVLVVGAFVILSTASRATIGLEAFGLSTVFVLSAARKWTSRKRLALIIGVIATAVVVPLAASSLEERFAAQEIDSGGTDWRAAYIKAAGMMLVDHPLGVGANYFGVTANIKGYYAKAGVPLVPGALLNNVHNAYLLTAAEIGYPGLIALLLLLSRPLIVALRCGWINAGKDYRGDLLLGLGVALLAVCLHSWVESICLALQLSTWWLLRSD